MELDGSTLAREIPPMQKQVRSRAAARGAAGGQMQQLSCAQQLPSS